MVKFFHRDKPKIKVSHVKREGLSGWLKCPECHQMVHEKEVHQKLQCCPKCDHHYQLSAEERIDLLTEKGSFEPLLADLTSEDRLGFVDTQSYKQRLVKAEKNSGKKEGVIIGTGKMGDHRIALGVMDFAFMAGSMGSVVGEKLTYLIEYATKYGLPLILVCASGGARMQESMFSLMQMAKTSGALKKHSDAKLPYISILTHPTTGGVTASFASLGDLIFAEPKALICFAGPRVVEQVTKEKLPKGAQRAEFLLEHGMVDAVVSRADMKKKLSSVLHILMPCSSIA